MSHVRLLCVMLLAGTVAGVSTAPADTDARPPHLHRYKLKNLVLEPRSDDPSAYDSWKVECPMVIRDGDRWLMYYSAITRTDGKADSTIAVAESTDLIHWTRLQMVLPRGRAGEFDHGGVSGPFVWKEGDRFFMIYPGFPTLGYETWPGKHGLATSTDGLTWTRSPHNPIHGPGAPGSWNDAIVYKAFVLKRDGTYWMFYNAKGHEQRNEQIGLATSDDLVHWTQHPANPLIRAGDPEKDRDHRIIADPWIMRRDGIWEMYYFAFDGRNAREHLATSHDLIHWTKSPYNPIMDAGPPGSYDDIHCHKPSIVEHEGVIYHFYTACASRPDGDGEYRAIALATSVKLPGVAYRDD